MTRPQRARVGVLALQGGFHEHADLLKQAAENLAAQVDIETPFIRTAEELATCDALIIPGGESTTMMLLAKQDGLLGPLQNFVREKAVWGSCAGMICLSEQVYRDPAAPVDVVKEEKSQQSSIGGVDISVVRNQYGRQLASFEHGLQFKGIREAERPFPGIFIRAPIVHHVLDKSSNNSEVLDILCKVPEDCLPQPKSGNLPLGPDASLVAVRQGNRMVTSFHPELSTDPRIHEFFLSDLVLPSLSER